MSRSHCPSCGDSRLSFNPRPTRQYDEGDLYHCAGCGSEGESRDLIEAEILYTIRRTNLGSPALYHYTVHRPDCSHIRRATITYCNFDHIPGDLRIKIAVGTVSACGHCQPDLSPLRATDA